MIIMDYSQVSLSNIMVQIGNHTNAEIEESMCRHMVLNSIRSYKSEYSQKYGELVIACDNKNYWRRKVFPYYKANRKKSQQASELNWKEIFECLNKIKSEIENNFPYRVIDVDTTEADDIIGTLCSEYGDTDEPILILSGDKDFQQLQKYKNVFQYDPVRKGKIVCKNPEEFLKEHILRGDVGDGIPNFLSNDNCLVIGERQKSVYAKKVTEWLYSPPETFCDEVKLRNYRRNEQLIDLGKIPDEIKERILESYHDQKGKKTNGNILNYFIEHRLTNLTSNIGDFL